MRIAYITSMSGIGGGETGLLNTMQSTVALGHDPVLVCPPGALSQAAIERYLIVHTMDLPNVHLRGGFMPSVDVHVIRELRRTVVAERIDILHAESLLGLIYGGIVARLTGIPCVASYYGYWPLGLPLRLVLRFLCDRVFPIARCVADELVQGAVFTSDRMPIIPNELSPEFFSALPSKTDARKLTGLPAAVPIVMQIARFQKIKGQMTLIKAAEILLRSANREVRSANEPGVRRSDFGLRTSSCILPLFVFVGGVMSQYRDEIEYRDEVMVRARQAPLADHVLFLGHRTDIPLLLRAADVFVNPSDYETFGMSVLEAAAVGTPIVATNVGGPASLLTDQKTGLLVPPQNPAAMAEAISSMLRDPARASGIAQQAQLEARKLYAPGTKARRLIAEYEQMGKRQTTKPKRQTPICRLSIVLCRFGGYWSLGLLRNSRGGSEPASVVSA